MRELGVQEPPQRPGLLVAVALDQAEADLLGLSFAAENPDARTRYVLVNPGSVASSFAGEFDPETAALVERMKRAATPVDRIVPRLAVLVDASHADPVSAFVIDRPVDPRTSGADDRSAARLHRLTAELLRG